MVIDINLECFDTGLAEAVVGILVIASQTFVLTPGVKLALASFKVSHRARDAIIQLFRTNARPVPLVVLNKEASLLQYSTEFEIRASTTKAGYVADVSGRPRLVCKLNGHLTGRIRNPVSWGKTVAVFDGAGLEAVGFAANRSWWLWGWGAARIVV